MMRMKSLLHVLVLFVPAVLAFVAPMKGQQQTGFQTPSTDSTTTRLGSSPLPDPERLKQIMQEEASNPENMKASAEMMKNLKPEDIDNMLKEMDSMPALQRDQLTAMGMNPDMMRQSIEMMKSNPSMAKEMAKMMETMTPEEIQEKSRQAQANFGGVGATTAPAVVDAQVESSSTDTTSAVDDDEEEDDDDEEEEEEAEPIPAPDAEVLDAMFRAAELMSSPPTGGVTLQGFSTTPPIALLVGDDEERDLAKRELNECWADGSLGSTRVDRAGFERVWMEVQDFFSLAIMEKARERSVEKPNKRAGNKPKAAATASVPNPIVTDSPQVGASISSNQLEKQVKSMSDTDMDSMLDQMNEMTPEQEARMKAMGVDPAMLQKTAGMLKGNPLMKNAAKMMMKNMTPDQMKNASQQAQTQMSANPEQYQKMLDDMEKQTKK